MLVRYAYMSEPDSTVIAGTRSQPKTCGDWRAFRAQLSSKADAALWKAAFEDYFRDRIQLRYLAPIALLQQVDAKQGEGFAIIAIHCSLIEFLESTFQGKTYRFVKKGDKPLGPHEYSGSKDMFCSFLCAREPFAKTFNDLLALDFYENVRCALLHEARTRRGWKIRAGEPSGAILDPTNRLIFHRSFQSAIDQTIAWYEHALSATAVFGKHSCGSSTAFANS